MYMHKHIYICAYICRYTCAFGVCSVCMRDIHNPLAVLKGKLRLYASQHCVCETKPDSESAWPGFPMR